VINISPYNIISVIQTRNVLAFKDCTLPPSPPPPFRAQKKKNGGSTVLKSTVFSRLNTGGVYLKLGLVDPAFIYFENTVLEVY